MIRQALFGAALTLAGGAHAAALPELTAGVGEGARLEWSRNRWLRADARIQADVVRFADDVTNLADAEDFRRARFRLYARLDDWRALADYDAGISPGWKNLQVQYRGWDRVRVAAGNQTTPFSLEEISGSDQQVFLERSLASALTPGLLSGAGISTWGDGWTLAAGLFGNEFSDRSGRTMDGISLIARSSFAPIDRSGRTLQFGVSFEQRQIEEGESVRLRTRPETRLSTSRLADTRSLAGVDDITTTGLELLGLHGGVRLQGELLQMRLRGESSGTLGGGYLLLTALLTGEHYQRQRSTGAARPEGSNRAWGAIEAGLRFSVIDLEDGAIVGGRQNQMSAGLSWFADRSTRVTVDYSRFDLSPNRNGTDERGSMLMLRLQTAF